ncbi:MAG: FAD-binding oxidoreductase, partial [Gammaproteobacteria bacterium]
MLRRSFIETVAALPLAAAAPSRTFAAGRAGRGRVRPGDPAWPTPEAWGALDAAVGGRLIKVVPPFAGCAAAPRGADCETLFRNLRNPFFIGDDVALTQTLGWVDAWTSRPSAYAVAARSSAEVAAAVRFARAHNLRLVVKGGGHSYLGGSNAAASLRVWTRPMRRVEIRDPFVPSGCAGRIAPESAVSVGAGALWLDAYQAVTTQAGRYVQGGGCTTVGVAGLTLGGGFGSFSKGFGTAAANLLEAEVVTADGRVLVANPGAEPDLFWALKAGGGGSFGVATRLTLRTHDLPPFFGGLSAKVTAASDAAWRALVGEILAFYRTRLMNPHWGEQIGFHSGRRLTIDMVFQGLDQAGAEATWRPFFAWLAARGSDYAVS